MGVTKFENMIGKVMASIIGKVGDDCMTFIDEDGNRYSFKHYQDCCENVAIEDVCGDMSDLIGSPMLTAEEVDNLDGPVLKDEESYTWTFYRFGTSKGSVTIRWLGTSNGYYSERVDYSESKLPANK